jgi:precorrin-2 dehydrogenase/sirohydrochlorin ferrochelatase
VSMLPLAMKMTGKSVLVLGAGRIGVGKAALLVQAGARVTMIARAQLAPLPEGLASYEARDYRRGDLAGYALVISATGDPATNDLVVNEARDEGIWLNVVDDPERSDFYFTAVHRDGEVLVSVSTEGASPALAQVIRSLIRERLPSHLSSVARQLRLERAALHTAGTSTEGVDWKPRIRELLNDTDRTSENNALR